MNNSMTSRNSLHVRQKFCRLCLVNNGKISMFDEESILNSIISHCKLKVLKNDGLPESVCEDCVSKLGDVVAFIKQCQESERILKEVADKDAYKNNLNNSSYDYDNDVDYDYKDEPDFSYSDKIHSADEEEENKLLMDSIVKSESGEEYIYFLGVKIFVHRTKMEDAERIELRKKRMKEYDTNKQKIKTLCPICGKTSAKSLTTHMKIHGEKIFSCDICGKSFSMRVKLEQHMICHSNVRNFQCDYCEKRFKTKSDTKKHMITMHIGPVGEFPCIVCAKVFKNQKHLTRHITIHSGEKNFQCELCPKRFTHNHNLKLHMRVHTGERPYTCNYCGKSFSTSKNLREHERQHTGERPYECPACNKGFMQLSNMKSHFKNNHKGVEFKRKHFVRSYK